MKLLKHELIGAKLGEVRLLYQTGTVEEDIVIDELNKALDAIRAAGIQIRSYEGDDRHRFDGADD